MFFLMFMEVQSKENLVTVAIPFFNAQDFLSQAIESVFSQTYQDWKLLLIDDGSTDNSLNIAMKYEKDRRVIIHSDGKNRNLGFRLNQIPSLVDSKYLVRMDADDIMHPERIEKQLKVLESNPEIDVLGTNAYSIDANNLVQGIRLKFSDNDIIKKVHAFIHPTIMAKTLWFENNPYDIKAERIEDAELWFRSGNRFNFQILTEPLLFYREFGNNYYKKYFKGFPAMLYVLKKHSYNFQLMKFAFKYYLSGMVYFLYNLFGREMVLVKGRNAVLMNNILISDILK